MFAHLRSWACVFLLILAPAAAAAPNPGQNGVIRTWPQAKYWKVMLIHAPDKRFLCLDMTGGKSEANLGYVFGIEEDASHFYLLLADQTPETAADNTLAVIVDAAHFGTYRVDKRKSTAHMYSLRAEVPQAEAPALLSLIRTGKEIEFETDEADYFSQTAGMQTALDQFQSCLDEAQALANPI